MRSVDKQKGVSRGYAHDGVMGIDSVRHVPPRPTGQIDGDKTAGGAAQEVRIDIIAGSKTDNCADVVDTIVGGGAAARAVEGGKFGGRLYCLGRGISTAAAACQEQTGASGGRKDAQGRHEAEVTSRVHS